MSIFMVCIYIYTHTHANGGQKRSRVAGHPGAAQQGEAVETPVDLGEIHLQLKMCSKCARKSQKKGETHGGKMGKDGNA
jgi:hypothetical protein